MAVAVAQLTGEGIVGGAILPWLIVVERSTKLTVISHGVMHTFTDGINFTATATGMAIACTPTVRREESERREEGREGESEGGRE